jgi:hypothetical protein
LCFGRAHAVQENNFGACRQTKSVRANNFFQTVPSPSPPLFSHPVLIPRPGRGIREGRFTPEAGDLEPGYGHRPCEIPCHDAGFPAFCFRIDRGILLRAVMRINTVSRRK